LGIDDRSLEKPDRLVFDLDPGENVPWTAVIEAAHDVHDRLAALGLQSFGKTSGGKGLHVVVPIQPEAGWEEIKSFTKAIAEMMAKERPERVHAVSAQPTLNVGEERAVTGGEDDDANLSTF
jgi:bifunctional non-homologous end joining protein LigD